MIDFAHESPLTLQQAAEIVPWPGGQPTYETLRRWASKGVGGHRLEAVRCGGRVLTTKAAVHRFLRVLSGGVQITDSKAASKAASEARQKMKAELGI